ncbi:MAG: flagellar biosynthesis protein FlhA [Treponema sp.]|nr:flagellar biosynthesis protein FlhA [Treponema sp.]
MANESRGKFLSFVANNYVAVLAVLVLFFIVIPIPKFLIDLLMILNLAFSFVVLLAVIYTPRASDFQTFPRIILFQTILGMGINIASTRLILFNSGADTGAQSDMVQAFANIVAKNNLVVGFVIFIIIMVFQVAVVTKGAGRISEVAARFSLDSMTQKYFDVDNRLNSGIITDEEARDLKDAIRREVDFYSNMDGASKFVSGNVKAGIFVTVVNLLGGVISGSIYFNLDIGTAFASYASLTIGDGLLSQMPALVISVATGLLVTGNKTDEALSEQLAQDFTRSGYIYEIVGAVLILIGIGLRVWLIIPVGLFFIFVGYRMSRNEQKKNAASQEAAQSKEQQQNALANQDAEKIALLDSLSLELGFGLIPLVKKEKGAELLERISRIRNEAKLDMGFVIPKIRIQDNMTLNPNDYSFKIKGIEVGHASIQLGYYMCMDVGSVITPIAGEKTKDPTFGMDAIWVSEDRKAEAEDAGYVVVDPPTIIATHITEIIRSHAAEMLGREEVASIINTVKEKNPVLIDEVLNTAKLTYGQIEKVLQNLLEENVSIRNIVTILETLANYANISKSPWDLTEKVREALGLQICIQYADPETKKLSVIPVSQDYAEIIQEHGYYPQDGSKPQALLDPVDRRNWINSVSSAIARVKDKNLQPILICPAQIRGLVKASVDRDMPGIIVLSDAEVNAAGRNITVEFIDQVIQEEVG